MDEVNLDEGGDIEIPETPALGGTITLRIKAALRDLIIGAVQSAAFQALSNTVTALSSTLSSLSSTVGGHASSLGTHTTQIGTLQSDVGNVSGDLGFMTTTLNSHTGASNPHAGACSTTDPRLSDARTASVAALVDGDVIGRAGGVVAGKQRQLFAVAADVANSTTTLATVTGLQAALKANSTYRFAVDFDYITSGTAVGLQMSTAFTGTTTAVRFGLLMGTSATAHSNTVATAHGTKVGPTATGPGATSRVGALTGTLVTGASGGTFSVQFAAGAAGSATIRARSTLLVMQL